MAATVLLLRHAPHGDLGVTLSGRAAGRSLSDEGAMQAAALGARLAGAAIASVQASPLARAMETARAVAQACGVPVEPVAALDEIDFGAWTGRSFADLDRDPAWQAWNRARGSASPPGGESMVAAQARIVSHLQATARDHAGETVAMVTHCDMIRGAVAWVLGLTLDHLLRFDIDPGSITGIVVGDWGGRVLSLNEGIC